MDLRRLIGVNIATLAVLSALLVGMGKESPVLPLATAFAAAAAIWLTDVKGRFSLSPAAVNTIVVLIAAVTIWQFVLSRRAADLLVFADAFAYLQIVLLFEKKTQRTWWDLISLSLVQVLLSAQLREGPLFGLVLAAYLFFGLSVLMLLLFHRERACRISADGTGHGSERRAELAHLAGVNWPRLGKIALATVAVGPLSLFFRFRTPDDREDGPSAGGSTAAFVRWPWLGQTAAPVGSPACLADPATTGRAFWGQVVVMALVSILVSAVVFCAVPRGGRIDFRFPRFGQRVQSRSDGSVRRSVGFSDSVELGELGKIIEDPEQVLEVQLTHYASSQRYPVRGGVYLRGAVLNQYRAGKWTHHRSRQWLRIDQVGTGLPPTAKDLVRQTITIEPMDRDELFCIWPFLVTENTADLSYGDRERILRPRERRHLKFSFELGTTAFVDGAQADLAPCGRTVESQPLLQWPSEALQGLAALADQWVAESGIPEDDLAGRARFLESRLGRSGQFLYSLEAQERNPELDPIEDFVTSNRRGHCEYFATALALMLRSQKIPSRMVVGYKCDEYSYASDAYRVRQSHAHAWVEAYVPPGKVPAEARSRSGFSDRSRGGWLRLDPTPRSSAGVGMVDLVAHGVEDWLQWCRSVWRNDVVGMNRFRQRELIYRPIAERFMETTSRLASFHWWSDTFASLLRTLTAAPGRSNGRAQLAWTIGLFLLLAAAGLWTARRRVSSLVEKLIPRRARATPHRPRGDGPDVGFYRRFETLLARFQLTRRASETQREFARHAGQTLARLTGQAQLGSLPPQLAELFYGVRFGGSDLDDTQAAAVANALRQLEQAVDGNGKTLGSRRRGL